MMFLLSLIVGLILFFAIGIATRSGLRLAAPAHHKPTFRDMPLTTLEWYCPGVGLVKVERQEPANSTFLTGGTMTMELMAWE